VADEELRIDLIGLEGGWKRRVAEYPRCAACGERIGRPWHDLHCASLDEALDGTAADCFDCDCGADDVPFMVFRGDGRAMECLALHWACAEEWIY
jgi:hypothetical protein